MHVAYEPWLVLLSIVMAIQGAYVGFSLAVQIGGAVGMRRRLLLAGAGLDPGGDRRDATWQRFARQPAASLIEHTRINTTWI
jgi:hypothetical protein